MKFDAVAVWFVILSYSELCDAQCPVNEKHFLSLFRHRKVTDILMKVFGFYPWIGIW